MKEYAGDLALTNLFIGIEPDDIAGLLDCIHARYLTRLSREQHNLTIAIPMNRNAMAEYLNVERSALSRELSNMKRIGIIDYHKNRFSLI